VAVGGGAEADSDTVGKVALGAVGVGLATHAVLSNAAKRRELNRRIKSGIENEKQLPEEHS